MITEAELQARQDWTAERLIEAGYPLTEVERKRIEVADFGLGDIDHIGIQLITYVNTSRVCSKDIVMKPWQICPEHLHPPVEGQPGKEETFRCRRGWVLLYVPGEATASPECRLRDSDQGTLTVRNEHRLEPGDQYTVMPGTLHWFQAGSEGAIVTEFSTRSTDEFDIFTDTRISRIPTVVGK